MITHFSTVFEYASTLRAALEIASDPNYSDVARKVLGEFASDLIENFRIDDHGAVRIEKANQAAASNGADDMSALP